ncbi:protein SHQ1 homolog [Coccinella septempunctata]|uniref:protein SHQ1 homolog n=1 Tax=Coccinella septempunctata TaxID=41139 RepID=UPI001D076329|nr:protein SHQ1 homolog [Coccinella septempunctata]
MIIPIFRLSQTADTVTIQITAKYIKLKDLEFIVEHEQIYFYCKPYHLNLHLPASLESEILSSKYDVDTGVLTFVMKKTLPGEEFKNLEIITRLLGPAEEKKKGDKVLILDHESNVLWEDTPETSFKYGFAMKGLYDFHRVIDEYSDVIKVDPRKIDIEERLKLMRLEECQKFNVEHYIADFVEEEPLIQELVELESPWYSASKTSLNFDDAELEVLKDLPNKNYNLSEEQRRYGYYGLIDILFAFCYDCRTTHFEGNSESGWTILEIAASLRWLVGFQDARTTLLSAYRRSLTYPLYRNFNLCNKVFEDLKTILALGKVCIVKCLIQIYKIFLGGDQCRYILNDIFIKDYLVFVGKWNDDEWNNVVDEVSNVAIEKQDLNMSLGEIEKDFLTKMLQMEQLDSDDESADTEELPADLVKQFKEKLLLFEK